MLTTSSELFLPRSSIRQLEDDDIEHEIVTRLNKRNSKRHNTTHGHFLESILEQKWADLHSEEVYALAQGRPYVSTEADKRSTTPTRSSTEISTFLLDATPSPSWVEAAKHNLRETSQTRDTVKQKVADLYATASGIMPPYLLERLVQLGVFDGDEIDPGFPLGLDASEQIDQVKSFLVQLGRMVGRLSARTVVQDKDNQML